MDKFYNLVTSYPVPTLFSNKWTLEEIYNIYVCSFITFEDLKK